MENYQFIIKRKDELLKDEIISLCKLKDEHWHHGIDSQQSWFNTYIRNDDYNVCMLENNHLIGYLHMVNVDVKIGNDNHCMYGIGNVCVASRRKHSGLGLKLIFQANAKIIHDKKVGILLCRDRMISFYRICGWKEWNQILTGNEMVYPMFYNSTIVQKNEPMEIYRNF